MANGCVQFSENGYRIKVVVDEGQEEYSPVADLGEPVEWTASDGVRYLAFCDIEGGGNEGDAAESRLEHWLYEVKPVEGAETEDVERFEGDEDEEPEKANKEPRLMGELPCTFPTPRPDGLVPSLRPVILK